MQPTDVFIGGITALLGAAVIAGAALGNSWLLERRFSRSLVASWGQPAARALLGAIGLALFAVGIAIALGWRLNWF